jgi:hypothetical protein
MKQSAIKAVFVRHQYGPHAFTHKKEESIEMFAASQKWLLIM